MKTKDMLSQNYKYSKVILSIPQIKLTGINKKYVNRKYALSQEYRTLKEDLIRQAKKIITLKNKVGVLIRVATAKDIDSIIKGTLDSLQLAGTYVNDSQIETLLVEKVAIPRKKFEELEVTVFYND